MVKRSRCGTKTSFIQVLFLSAFLISTIISGAADPIKVTKTHSQNPELLTQNDVLETIVNQINETRFTWFDSILTNTIGPRQYNFNSNMQAAEFIAEELNSTGNIFAAYQWFSYAGEEIANVVGTLPSADLNNQSKIVVGAHFDTVADSPGADDNGSGTALLLEVAKVLSLFRFDCTIEFVVFNAEEGGLWGSKYYAQQAVQAGEDILLVINIDMCIWDNPGAPSNEKLWIVYNGTVSYEDSEQFADLTLETSYTYVAAPIQKMSSTNDTYVSVENWRRSDQASFWDAGIPALWIFEFNGFQNPYIHTPADSMGVESYNFTLGTRAAQVVAATVAKLARARMIDTTPPNITGVSQTPTKNNVLPRDEVKVNATVTDVVSGVERVALNYTNGNGTWVIAEMTNLEANL
ncbi:MAG: M28 family metallopeptidase, partial [Candidatus Bathyarchaeota archaeon]|nr:M28 family metallopeptidase [Candidatus Bathyarchaeota archaeon]